MDWTALLVAEDENPRSRLVTELLASDAYGSVEFLLGGFPSLTEARPELGLGDRQDIPYLNQPPQAARVVVEPVCPRLVPEPVELVELKLVGLENLDLADLFSERAGDLEELDRTPVRGEQRGPLRRRTAGGNRQGIGLALCSLFVECVENLLVEGRIPVRKKVDEQ